MCRARQVLCMIVIGRRYIWDPYVHVILLPDEQHDEVHSPHVTAVSLAAFPGVRSH